MLDVAAIDTFYGETQALFGVSLSVRAGEVRGAARRQRRRQDHGAALDPRPDARAPRRHPLPGQIHHRPPHARDRPRRHRLGARRPPPVSDADSRQEPQPRREANRLPSLVDGPGDRHLHAAQVPDGTRGRDAVGRRDADGGHRPRPAGRAGPHAARRAEPGPRPQDRRRRAGRDPPPQGGRDRCHRRGAERRCRPRRRRPRGGARARSGCLDGRGRNAHRRSRPQAPAARGLA